MVFGNFQKARDKQLYIWSVIFGNANGLGIMFRTDPPFAHRLISWDFQLKLIFVDFQICRYKK